ncbi:phenol hydroxylase subunit P4 [Streptomyces sp. NPDC096012]|uniref:phenol hydroxylase subunit P4 n=1 Tax=Streptomyces sp. NPDC096012 TaxID=3155684 RepID=UPI003369C691
MPVVAINDTYDFPSRSRQELYGEDLLVHVMWKGNPFFAAAATFRAPRTMPWGEFLDTVVEPWAANDPDHRPGSQRGWTLDGAAFTPAGDASLEGLGIGHKSVLTFGT